MNVGTAGFSEGWAWCISLAFNPSNEQLCVAFQDNNHAQKATVMIYDSVISGINDTKELKFILQPNPVANYLTIYFKDVNSNFKFIEIYDLRGEKIFESETNKNRVNINVENYSNGIYSVKVNNNTSISISKFIKN